MARKMSLLIVKRALYKTKRRVGRGRVKPIEARISALWDSPMAIWEPQE